MKIINNLPKKISPSDIFKTFTLECAIVPRTQWIDILTGEELETGVYVVYATLSRQTELFGYAGIMHWDTVLSISGKTDEIPLHSSKEFNSGIRLYLRTARGSDGVAKMQAAFSEEGVSYISLIFKFRKIF